MKSATFVPGCGQPLLRGSQTHRQLSRQTRRPKITCGPRDEPSASQTGPDQSRVSLGKKTGRNGNVPAYTSTRSSSKGRTGTITNAASTVTTAPEEDAQPQSTEWECNEDAECEVVECGGPEQKACKTPLNVRIGDDWYDLSGWRAAHPAGAHWIDYYNGRDATEVMYGFHSQKAIQMFSRLPKSKSPPKEEPPVTSTMLNFRKLREKLEAEGWMERDFKHEAILLGLWGATYVGGICLVHVNNPIAQVMGMLSLAVANTQTGWLAHDYIHGVDDFSKRMRYFGPLFGGMSINWWSDKHNKHHALTNEAGVDEDIMTDPALFVYPPPPEADSPRLRSIQHLLSPVWLSMLFWIWRIDSLKLMWEHYQERQEPAARAKELDRETVALGVHWLAVLALVPLHIIPQYITLSGLITAIIVTVTHQSEEIFFEYQPDFVEAQFRSSRDAKCRNAFTEWLWGGMQYQLEHHLFPNMPRSRYPALQPMLLEFAEENQIPNGFRITDELEIVKLNFDLYERVAKAPADPSNPATKGRDVQAAHGYGGKRM